MTQTADALDRLFSGPLAHCAETLALGPDAPGFDSVADLLRPGVMDAHLERFGRAQGRTREGGSPGGDPRAVYSLWTQWYFGTALVPMTAIALGLRRVLPVGLEEVGVRLSDDERQAEAVRLNHAGRPAPDADDLTLLAPIVLHHVAPLVNHFARHSGLAARTLWGNAAAYMDWAIRQVRDLPDDALHELFTRAAWDDQRPNPLRGALRVVDAENGRIVRRRVCCLRFRIPGMSDCGAICPLPGSSRR